jgi:hypothetical protein
MNMDLSTIDNLAKSQPVRLFDIYALGPFMMWYAYKTPVMGRWPRRALFISGFMTVIYNWQNYRNIEADLKARIAAAQEGL